MTRVDGEDAVSWPQTQRKRTPVVDLAYIWIRFYRKHGRLLRVFDPHRYNEKIQWRKLFDFNPLFAAVSDKHGVRDFIAERIGRDYLVPLLWAGENPEEIPFGDFGEPFVVKCTHGNAMNLFFDDSRIVDRQQAVSQLRRWMRRDHGRALVEPGHIGLVPRIIVESMLRGPDGCPPTEYKFFMFDGKAALIAIRLNRDHFVHANLFVTPDWEPTPIKFDTPRFEGELPPRPKFYDEMSELAGRIASGFDHVRVDFLATGERFFVGELSLYPQSGMVPVEPDCYDLWLGRRWRLDRPGRRALDSLLGRFAGSARRNDAP
jgi:hypothetical protein